MTECHVATCLRNIVPQAHYSQFSLYTDTILNTLHAHFTQH